MGRPKMPLPTPFHKKVLNNIYLAGMNNAEAYCDAKGIELPEDGKERQKMASYVSIIKQKNPTYIQELEEKNLAELEAPREALLKDLNRITVSFFNLLELAEKDKLTKKEQDKFRRIKSIISTKDANKALELIAKLTGSFEPEKHQVTTTFKVDFGTPLIGEGNIQEADFEEIEDE